MNPLFSASKLDSSELTNCIMANIEGILKKVGATENQLAQSPFISKNSLNSIRKGTRKLSIEDIVNIFNEIRQTVIDKKLEAAIVPFDLFAQSTEDSELDQDLIILLSLIDNNKILLKHLISYVRFLLRDAYSLDIILADSLKCKE